MRWQTDRRTGLLVPEHDLAGRLYSPSNQLTGVYSPGGVAAPTTIAYDNATLAAAASFSHTCSALGNRILFIGIANTTDTTDDVTTVTYNGVGATRINTLSNGTSNWRIYLYYLIAPATGSNTVASNGTVNKMGAISYTGAKQSAQPDANNTGDAVGATSLAIAVTTIADNCWVVEYAIAGDILSAGAVTTLRVSDANNHGLFDSGGVVTPAGSRTLTVTRPTSGTLMGCVASFSPV